MSLWFVIAAMAAATAAILLFPLLRKARGAARLTYDLAVYRDQLAEVARDEARGTLSAADAASARIEIERRVLAAGEATPSAAGARVSRAARITIVAAAILGPMAATALYLERGTPHMRGYPFAARNSGSPDGGAADVDMAKIEKMVDGLAQRMANAPNDLKGWTMLGRSYAMLQRYDDAAAAFAHAATLDPKNAELPASQGETLVFAAGGIVTPKARDAFEQALAIDSKDPRSRFYLGLASMQAGQPQAALAAWEALAAEAPKDAPWLSDLTRQIAKLKEALAAEPKEPSPAKTSPKEGPADQKAGEQPAPDKSGSEKTSPPQ